MKKRFVFIWYLVAFILINVSFIIAIKLYPQIVYGYALHAGFNFRYPSTTMEESMRRGCFISEYQGDTLLNGFLEHEQYLNNGKTINSQNCLYFILDCRSKNDLLDNSIFSDPHIIYRKGKRLYFEISDKYQPVPILDTLEFGTETYRLYLIKRTY